jgi:hypothetical protein
MKPREKVVTAEDIQSSFFFIHVNQPEDVRLVEPSLASGPDLQSPSNPISRKAVPTMSPSPGAPLAPRRKPVPGTLAPVDNFENKQNINASNYSQNLSPNYRPDYSQRASFESGQYIEEEDRPPLPPRMPTETSTPTGTTLTLIRRDPASDFQWNVACIEDPPVLDISSSTISDPTVKNKYGAPFYIQVTNPGYSKFLNNPEKQELLRQSTELSMMSQMPAHNSNSHPLMPPSIPASPLDTRGGADQGDGTFRRRLWMEGSKHRSRSSHDFSIGRESPRSSGEAYNRDFRAAGPPSPLLHDDRQPGFRGYVFKSPWNGRCEFVTGAAGDTLKVSLCIYTPSAYDTALRFFQCRHILSGLQGATPMAMPVSELRFNLPSSSKGEDSSKRSSLFHRPKHSRNHSGVSEMDLSLGQEFAGGGYGGKQAKLGKLIIEDEGLKMLDLLVAANMALWWRAYERVDSKYRA